MRGDGPDGRPPPDGDGPGAPRRPAGALEAEVLAVLQAAGTPLTLARCGAAGPRSAAELSYSTVVTIVSRLHAKGLAARRAGRARLRLHARRRGRRGRRTDAAGAGARRRPGAVLTRFASGLSGRDARLLRALLAGGDGAGQERG